jgi:hypothetical protein
MRGQDSRPAAVGRSFFAVERIAQIQSALGDAVTLKRLVGTGGFAEVYEGVDTRLERSVAVKVMRADVAAPRARDRFLREARAAAQIRHPNVLAVFDVGEKGEIVWLTMPFVTGESLRTRLDREKRIAPDEATRILSAAASGLHAAHRARLVHRDVKPDNILLDGSEGHVLIADFGVAAAVAEEGDRITTEGAVIGTPRYMSPEQAAGESVVDARADVYSLGVVGYEMVCGEPPFTAANAGALLAKHLTAPVPPIRSRVSDCPWDLSNAIERALEKDPADRWPAADAMRLALEGRASSRISTAQVAEADAHPGRSRATIILSVTVLAGAIVADITMRALLFSPIAAIGAAIALGITIGAARVANAQRPSGERAAATMRRVRRARAMRTASRALLISMPKAERARFAGVELALDELMFEVEQLAEATGGSGDLDRALLALTEIHAAIEAASVDAGAISRVADLVTRHTTVSSRPAVTTPS